MGDERSACTLGDLGHGVFLSQSMGRLLADLLGGRGSELARFGIVNRKALPWPPRPLAWPLMLGIYRGCARGAASRSGGGADGSGEVRSTVDHPSAGGPAPERGDSPAAV